MGRIEHYRNVCRDWENRLMKESEKFDEAVARKSALQDEINEIEARIAEESRAPPGAPSGPLPVVQEAFLPPPEKENEEDTQMENQTPVSVAGVGAFVSPSKKKVIKSPFRKRASLRLMESRSSVFAKLSKLISQELLKLGEQCSALAKDSDPDLSMDVPALPATSMMHKVRSWGNISRRKSSGNEEDILFELCCEGPNRFKAAKTLSTPLDLFPGLSF